MKCPVCSVDLVMSERQGVEIDYCPQCRGIWLDRGELDKIVERFQEGTRPAPPPPGAYQQGTTPPGPYQQGITPPGGYTQAPQPGGPFGGVMGGFFGHGEHHGDDHHGRHDGYDHDEHGSYDEHGRRRRRNWLEDIFD